jgi:hypothetical protein
VLIGPPNAIAFALLIYTNVNGCICSRFELTSCGRMDIDRDAGNIWVSSLSLNTNIYILQAAYKAVRKRLTENGLSVDIKKCELIHFTKQKQDLNNLPSISIPSETAENMITIPPSPHIKWLGIIFDSKLNFHEHVHKVTAKLTQH